MKRRKRSHKRRSSTGLSAHRSPVRRKSHRRRGLFDGITSKANLMESAKNVGLGALGGAASTIASKALVGFKLGLWGKILTGVGGGFVASAFGFPKLGVGFAGGMTALTLNESGLKDELEETDNLEDLPVYQTEDGQFVKMLHDGEIVPLSEAELADINKVYPEYSTMNPFQQ